MGGDTGLTHLIQELHESFQNGSVEALSMRPQIRVSEEHGKESSVLVGGRVEFLKPMFGVRNRGYHTGGDRLYRFTWAYPFVGAHPEEH